VSNVFVLFCCPVFSYPAGPIDCRQPFSKNPAWGSSLEPPFVFSVGPNLASSPVLSCVPIPTRYLCFFLLNGYVGAFCPMFPIFSVCGRFFPFWPFSDLFLLASALHNFPLYLKIHFGLFLLAVPVIYGFVATAWLFSICWRRKFSYVPPLGLGSRECICPFVCRCRRMPRGAD